MSLPLKENSMTLDPEETFAVWSLNFLAELVTSKIFVQPPIGRKEYHSHILVDESETTILSGSKL